MSAPTELFPGFKVPPTDPSRDMLWRARLNVQRAPEEEVQMDDNFDDADAGREWCDHCANTGSIDCHCGGDLCICQNQGEYPCPNCNL